MTVQHNINIIGRIFRRNVHQPKLQSISRKIDNQGPILIPIAVAAHNRQPRTNRLEIQCDRRFANIAQMPDLVRLVRKIENLLGQLVMGVSQNENLHSTNLRTANTTRS